MTTLLSPASLGAQTVENLPAMQETRADTVSRKTPAWWYFYFRRKSRQDHHHPKSMKRNTSQNRSLFYRLHSFIPSSLTAQFWDKCYQNSYMLTHNLRGRQWSLHFQGSYMASLFSTQRSIKGLQFPTTGRWRTSSHHTVPVIHTLICTSFWL